MLSTFSTNILSVKEDLFLFNFIPIYTSAGNQYLVTIEQEEKMHAFTMNNFKGAWKILDRSATPAWIMAMEEELSKTIISNNK